MKIEYRQAGVAGGYATLMDVTAGDTIEIWEPSYSARPQIDELASNANAGAGVYTQALGNIRCDIPIRNMNVIYATLAAAMAASRTVPAAFLNLRMVLRVTEGTEIQYFASVVTRSFKPRIEGRSVTYNGEFTASGTASSVEPA